MIIILSRENEIIIHVIILVLDLFLLLIFKDGEILITSCFHLIIKFEKKKKKEFHSRIKLIINFFKKIL